jgi:hypothetical protein
VGSGGGRGGDVIVDIRGAINRREDPGSTSLCDAEDSGGSADQGPKEHPTSGRSNGRVATGAVGSFWWTGV